MEKIIKSITLEIDGKEITVTEDQARKMHAALADLLGEPKERVSYVPNITPYVPTWTPPPMLPTITSTGFPNEPVKVWMDADTGLLKNNASIY